MQCTFRINTIEHRDMHGEDELRLVKENIANAFGVDEDEVQIIEYMESPM